MNTKKLAEQIYMLEDRFGFCAYLVAGKEKALLFDTAFGADDIKAEAEKITNLPLLVIASHGHFDHIGGSRFFEKVYLSDKDRNILDEYTEEQLNRWLIQSGYPENEPPVVYGCGEWKQIVPLDFDRFDLGNLEGQIIPLPGHSHGSVGVYFPVLKVLLAGDALSPVMVLMFKNHGTAEEQYQTVQKALTLDLDYFLTAHNNKPLKKDVLVRMADCLTDTENKRFYDYAYPAPPFGSGRIHVHSLEDEPVGLILEK